MNRRVVQRVVLSLIFGAIVNVAVGIGLALLQPPYARVLIQPPPPIDWPTIDANTSPIALTADEMNWMAKRGLVLWQAQTKIRDERNAFGKQSTIYARTISEYWNGSGLLRFDCGWPAYAFSGQGTGFVAQQIPSEVVWPGFMINTIFYAAILWVIFFVPGKVRRTLRRRRNLCPACAYPIGTWGGEVCTECGGPLGKLQAFKHQNVQTTN